MNELKFRIESAKTEWDEYKDMDEPLFYVIPNLCHQPEVSFSIGWNVPKKFWKPYIHIQIIIFRLNIGWLY